MAWGLNFGGNYFSWWLYYRYWYLCLLLFNLFLYSYFNRFEFLIRNSKNIENIKCRAIMHLECIVSWKKWFWFCWYLSNILSVFATSFYTWPDVPDVGYWANQDPSKHLTDKHLEILSVSAWRSSSHLLQVEVNFVDISSMEALSRADRWIMTWSDTCFWLWRTST